MFSSKRIFHILSVLVLLSCNSKLETNYQWIRSYSKSSIQGAEFAVKDKGNKSWDLEMLSKMKSISYIMDNTFDSISFLQKVEILNRTQSLIDDLEVETQLIKKFYTLNSQSSIEDFKLQLALLEYELINYYVLRIGLMDITFDRLDLIFIPDKINETRIVGRLIFSARVDQLEGITKMYINEQEIPIKGDAGLVDIPVSKVKNGRVLAKIEFNEYEFSHEQEIEIKAH